MKNYILCALAVLLLTTACGETASTGTQSAALPDTADIKTDESQSTENASCPIDLSVDLNGETLTLGTIDSSGNGVDYTTGIFVSEDSGNNLDEAVYERNRWVEENLNCHLALHTLTSTTIEQIPNAIRAGDCDIQVLYGQMQRMGIFLKDGMLLDMNTISTLDWEAPWWDDITADTTVIAGKRFFTMSDTDYHSFYGFSMVSFNQTLEKQLIDDGTTDPFYSLVDKGKWTYDVMYSLGKAVIADLDGDGEFSFRTDRYGIGADSTNATLLVLSSGARFTRIAEDGTLENAIEGELFEKTFSKVLELYTIQNLNANPNVLKPDEGYGAWKFYLIKPLAEDRCLFNIATFATHAALRNSITTSTYGFLPCPKLNEEQTDYYTPVSYWNGTFLGVPVSAQNPDFVGTVLNAMEYKSEDTVIPAFYNVALNYKYATDEDSIRMLDIIRQGVVVDIGVAFNFGSFQDKLTAMSKNGTNTFSSAYASRQSSIEKAIDSLMTTIYNLEN
ncbi:MAG: hypothetical protein MJ175_09720 [Clostridia bacterium]|nr:hypothetical protein [Clostridia bacterium]